MGPDSLLARYEAGEEDAVWTELRGIDTQTWSDDVAADAWAVCRAMAGRARHNIGVVVARLHDEGFRFHSNDPARSPIVPHVPPGRCAGEVGTFLADRVGRVP